MPPLAVPATVMVTGRSIVSAGCAHAGRTRHKTINVTHQRVIEVPPCFLCLHIVAPPMQRPISIVGPGAKFWRLLNSAAFCRFEWPQRYRTPEVRGLPGDR